MKHNSPLLEQSAIERYPGDQTEALKQLAKDVSKLEPELEASLQRIHSFEAKISASVRSHWKNDMSPTGENALVPDSQPAAEVQISLADDSAKKERLFLTGSFVRLSPLEKGMVGLS